MSIVDDGPESGPVGKPRVGKPRVGKPRVVEPRVVSPLAGKPRVVDVAGLSLRLGTGDGALLLDDVTLHVEAGETVGLVGESGSGKSLTARAILALLPARSTASGTVQFGSAGAAGSAGAVGVNMLTTTGENARIQRRTVASMVFQDPRSGVNPVRRIGDFMTESLRLCHGWDQRKASERAIALLGDVGLPDPARHMKQYQHELSGGMLQRVMIAAALATEPKLLLCDEPTTALDVTTQAEIIGILKEQQRLRGMGMLFITHDLNLAAAICDRVYVMKSGRIVEQGSAVEVFAEPQHEYTRRLVDATPTLDLAAGAPAAVIAASDALLTVAELVKRYPTKYGTVTAVDGVSFRVQPGEAFGLVGESGSGKSTIARLLVGLEHADSGSISLEGRSMDARIRGREARLARARDIQIVFQDPYLSLDPRMPIGRSIEDVLRLHYADRGTVLRERVRQLLDQVGLGDRQAQAVPRTLSGGQRQRAAIAKALAVAPKLLVLDEATSALDVSVQSQVLELINGIRREQGLALVFVSHDLAVVQKICENTLVLRRGREVEHGPTARLLADPQSAYTRLLISSVPRRDWDLESVRTARAEYAASTTR